MRKPFRTKMWPKNVATKDMAGRLFYLLSFLSLCLLTQNEKTAHAQFGNALASLAASMQPGTFALLNQDGDSDSTFTQKCAQAVVLGCYGFDSPNNVRDFPSGNPYPLKYGGWNSSGPCATAGLGTEYTYTQPRNFGTPPGSLELNALITVQ